MSTKMERLEEGSKNLFDKLLAGGPYFITLFIFGLNITSLVALLFVDIWTGQITSNHIITDPVFAWFVSFATTGLLTVAVAVVMQIFRKKWSLYIAVPAAVAVVFLLMFDIFFDGMSVDIKRFGAIVVVSEVLSAPEAFAHNMFRVLVAGLSLVGEPLAASAIIIFPLLKELLDNLVDNSSALRHKLNYSGSATRTGYPTKSVPTWNRPSAEQYQAALHLQTKSRSASMELGEQD